MGVSTRGALCLYRASQALALVENREYVIPDDVKRLAVPVLSHRVIAKGYVQGTQRHSIEGLVARLVDEVRVPRVVADARRTNRRACGTRQPPRTSVYRWLKSAA